MVQRDLANAFMRDAGDTWKSGVAALTARMRCFASECKSMRRGEGAGQPMLGAFAAARRIGTGSGEAALVVRPRWTVKVGGEMGFDRRRRASWSDLVPSVRWPARFRVQALRQRSVGSAPRRDAGSCGLASLVGTGCRLRRRPWSSDCKARASWEKGNAGGW